MFEAGSIDIDSLHRIVDDITEIQTNISNEEWVAVQERLNKWLGLEQ